jgi:membrane protein
MNSSTRVSPGVLRRCGRLVWWTLRAFFTDKVPRLGAALAFYTTIAIAPLLILTIALAGVFFEEGQARQRVLGEIESLAGRQAVEALATIETPDERTGNAVATGIGLGTLLLGGFSVFVHLQDALNVIWRVRPRETEGWLSLIKRRIFSFSLVITTGFILLVSLVLSAVLTWITQTHFFNSSTFEVLSQPINNLLSFAVTMFLFAMIFKVLPDRTIQWRDVWLGSAVTSFLFTHGKYGIGVYLAHASRAAFYGVAGSVITLLLWTYFAAQIALLGAEFTRIQATTNSGRKPPEKHPT